MKLGELLANLGEQQWNHWVFVAETDAIDADTDCVVMDTFDVDLAEDGDTPKAIADIGYSEFLQIVDLESITENLRHQKPDFSRQDYLEAVLYYYRDDAFVQLNT